jgi:hypothetical protein
VKTLRDNWQVLLAFALVALLNAYAITKGWYQ